MFLKTSLLSIVPSLSRAGCSSCSNFRLPSGKFANGPQSPSFVDFSSLSRAVALLYHLFDSVSHGLPMVVEVSTLPNSLISLEHIATLGQIAPLSQSLCFLSTGLPIVLTVRQALLRSFFVSLEQFANFSISVRQVCPCFSNFSFPGSL